MEQVVGVSGGHLILDLTPGLRRLFSSDDDIHSAPVRVQEMDLVWWVVGGHIYQSGYCTYNVKQ